VEYQQIIDACNRALEAVRPSLPPPLYQEAYDLINVYDEWGLAIEYVIDCIGELELDITGSQLRAIETAMTAMGWGQSERMVWLRRYCEEPCPPR
jgi:hypothetical protein